jgi:hypothetical protein
MLERQLAPPTGAISDLFQSGRDSDVSEPNCVSNPAVSTSNGCEHNDFVLSAVCLSAMGFAFALAFLRIRLGLVELPATLHHP